MIRSIFGKYSYTENKSIKRKLTPNEFAKEILGNALIVELESWHERHRDQLQNATDREIDEIGKQLTKRARGLLKYLGLFETYDGGMFFPKSDDSENDNQ